MAIQAETETGGKLDRTYTDPGEVLKATFLEVIPIVMVS